MPNRISNVQPNAYREEALVNPFNSPEIHYLTTFFRVHLDAARAEDRSRGASAIEWAIITAAAAGIAILVTTIILGKVKEAANQTKTNPGV